MQALFGALVLVTLVMLMRYWRACDIDALKLTH